MQNIFEKLPVGDKKISQKLIQILIHKVQHICVLKIQAENSSDWLSLIIYKYFFEKIAFYCNNKFINFLFFVFKNKFSKQSIHKEFYKYS